MHYIIHALDRADALARRQANYEAHKAYLAGKLPVRIVISGPLVAKDNTTMIGSFFLVEADRREDVEAFHHADPFRAADIWEHVSIHPFLKRQDSRV